MAFRVINNKVIRVLCWYARVSHGYRIESTIIVFPIFIPVAIEKCPLNQHSTNIDSLEEFTLHFIPKSQATHLYPLYGGDTLEGCLHWLICKTLMKSTGWTPNTLEGNVNPQNFLVLLVA